MAKKTNLIEEDNVELNENPIYETDMAPLPAKPPIEEGEETPSLEETLPEESWIILTKGATYRFRGMVFKKGVPEPVAPPVAERLIASGFFVAK